MTAGIYKRTEQHRINLSKALKGHPKLVGRKTFLRRKHTPESNEKNRLSHLGKKHSEETKQKMRAKALIREKSETWKGGRYTDRYVHVYHPEHPSSHKNGYVYEHRVVMESKLCRYLNKDEVVHHINGNKCDNRIENLELFRNRSEHLKHHMKDSHPRWGKKSNSS